MTHSCPTRRSSVLKAVRSQSLAQRQEMIILHPIRIVRLDQRDQAVRELLVDAFIAAAELILILGKVDAIMEERPERAVGIAVVIFLDVLRLEVDRDRKSTRLNSSH